MNLTALQLLAGFAHKAGDYLERARRHLFVSSWSVCADSMAMWHIYGSSGRGLAIKSSEQRLESALCRTLPESHYRFGRIAYESQIENSSAILENLNRLESIPAPGDKLWPKVLAKGFVKRSAYEHEKEWRAAIYQDIEKDVKGIDIPCSFDVLIDSVVLGPYAADFMVDVVKDLMERFSLSKDVSKSDLLTPPPGATES